MISQFACEGKNPLKPLAIMKKEKAIIIRLTREDFDRLNALAHVTGLSREEYARRLFLGATVKENPPADYGEILRELRCIGRNVDQILVKARSLGFIDNVLYQDVANSVFQMEKMFRKTFSK